MPVRVGVNVDRKSQPLEVVCTLQTGGVAPDPSNAGRNQEHGNNRNENSANNNSPAGHTGTDR